MCGIAGVWRFDGSAVDHATLSRMAVSLRHRGPDATGIWHEGSVGLAHTRLAVIDLHGSEQPMASPGELHQLVFNGEILNYRELRRDLSYPFRTSGDTEVILALYDKYGAAGVEYLRGQFAYAIYDSVAAEIHLFRDRLGILPLYYYVDDKLFAFASEIKALLPLVNDVCVDQDSLHDYLAHRAVPGPHTFIKGIRKLPQGGHLVVKPDGRLRLAAYWRLSAIRQRKMSDLSAIDLVDKALSESVSDALTADVSVGVYLSGGLDSSLLTALIRRVDPAQQLHTFGASFGDKRYDESSWARKVASLFECAHHEVVVGPNDFLQNWAELSWNRDGPLSDPADVAIFRLAQTAREHVKVVLSGEGSDELFGGYPKYLFAVASRLFDAVPLSGHLARLERRVPGSWGRIGIAMRALSESDYPERMRGWFAPFTSEERRLLTNQSAIRRIPEPYSCQHGDSLYRMLYADTCIWLADNLLERGDRMSMAASLETRPPFLDHRLVELAFELPSRAKVRGVTTKWVLKQLAHRYLPGDVVDRPKIGFKVPLDRWFRDGLREMAFDLLRGPSSYVGSNLNSEMITKLLDGHSSGYRNEESRIWTLLSLEVWHRELVKRQDQRIGA